MSDFHIPVLPIFHRERHSFIKILEFRLLINQVFSRLEGKVCIFILWFQAYEVFSLDPYLVAPEEDWVSSAFLIW